MLPGQRFAAAREVGRPLRERCKAALVDPCLDVPVSNALQIDHRGRDVAVSHPLLQCADVDPILKVSRRVGVAKLMKEPSPAVGSIGTAIHLHRSVFQLVSHHTMSSIEFGAKCYSLEFLKHGAIRFPRFAWEQRIIGAGILGTKPLQ